MIIHIAAPSEVDAIWHKIETGIQKACAVTNEFSAGQMFQMCRSGNAFLILVRCPEIIMASVWRFIEIEGRHYFHCYAIWGADMRSWMALAQTEITAFAKRLGATRLSASGRDGWLRLFNATKNANNLLEVDI